MSYDPSADPQLDRWCSFCEATLAFGQKCDCPAAVEARREAEPYYDSDDLDRRSRGW